MYATYCYKFFRNSNTSNTFIKKKGEGRDLQLITSYFILFYRLFIIRKGEFDDKKTLFRATFSICFTFYNDIFLRK